MVTLFLDEPVKKKPTLVLDEPVAKMPKIKPKALQEPRSPIIGIDGTEYPSIIDKVAAEGYESLTDDEADQLARENARMTKPPAFRGAGFTGGWEEDYDGKTIEQRAKDVLSIADQFKMNIDDAEDYQKANSIIKTKKLKSKGKIGFWEAAVEDIEKKLPFSPAGVIEMIDILNAMKRLSSKDEGIDLYKYYRDMPAMVPMAGTGPGAGIFMPAIGAGATPESDKVLLENYFNKMSERQKRGYSLFGKVGAGISQLPAWMVEFAMTGGLRKLGQGAAKEFLKDKVKSKLAKELAGEVAGAAIRTTIGMPHRVAERTLYNQLNEDSENWATSFAKGWGEVFISALSEQAGEYITGGLKTGIGKLPFGSKFMDGLHRAWVSLSPENDTAKFFAQIFNKAGYSNIIGEIGEERLETILRATTAIDDYGAGEQAGPLDRLIAGLSQDIENFPAEAIVLSTPAAGRFALGKFGAKILPISEVERGAAPETKITPAIKPEAAPEITPTMPEAFVPEAAAAIKPTEPTIPIPPEAPAKPAEIPPEKLPIEIPTNKPKLNTGEEVTGLTRDELERWPKKVVNGKIQYEQISRSEYELLKTKQALGEKVGYKVGYKQAIAESKVKIQNILSAKEFGEEQRTQAKELVEQYIPKNEIYKYINRILNAKTEKRVADLGFAIGEYIEKANKKLSIRELRNFISDTKSEYRSGQAKFGKLPDKVRQKFIDFLDKYDLAKLSEEKAEELSSREDYVNRIAKDVGDEFENLDFEEGMDADVKNILSMGNPRLEELNRLYKTHIGKLDTDEINYVTDSLKELIKIHEFKNSIKERTRAEKLRDEINRGVTQIKPTVKTGEIIERFPTIKYLVKTGQSRIDTLIKFATGKDNDAVMNVLWENPKKGLVKQWGKYKEFTEYAKSKLNQIGFTKEDAKKYFDESIEVTLWGKTTKLPVRLLTSLYAHTQAEGNFERLLKTNGMTLKYKDKDSKTGLFTVEKTIRFNPENKPYDKIKLLGEIKQAVAKLPDKYKRFIDNVVFDTNRNSVSPAVNEIWLDMFGFEKARFEKYFSFPREHERPIGGETIEISVPPEGKGRFQPRTGGNNRLVLVPADVEFMTNLQDAAALYGMAKPLKEARTLLANKKFRESMKSNGQEKTLKQIDTLFKRIQGFTTDQSIIERKGSALLGNIGKSILSLRLSGGLVQLTSPPAAFSVIEPKYFINTDMPSPSLVNHLIDIDPLLWYRWKARAFDFVLGDVAARHSFEAMMFDSMPISDKMLEHYTIGDKTAITKVYMAAERKIKAETDFKRGTTEFENASIELLHKAMSGQGQYDMLHRSDLTSSPNVAIRGSNIFMSTMNAFYNTIEQSVDDYKKGRIGLTEASRGASGPVISVALGTVVRRMARLGVKAGALGLLSLLGYQPEKKDRYGEVLKSEAIKEIEYLPKNILFEEMGLSAFGQLVSSIASNSLKYIEKGYLPSRPSQIRTGNIFADISLDVSEFIAQTGLATKQLITQEKYKQGPNKGKFKWIKTSETAGDLLAELVLMSKGLPYGGPKSDIYYPIKGAITLIEKEMSDADLEKNIKEHTYQKSYKRKDGKIYPAGYAHEGYEEKVDKWKAEQERRKSK